MPTGGDVRCIGEPDAVTCRHQRQHQIGGRDALRDLRLGIFYGTQQSFQLLVAPCARLGIAEYQRKVQYFPECDALVCKQRMPRRYRHHDRILPGRLGDNARLEAVEQREACIVEIVLQPFQLLRQWHFEQSDLDIQFFFPAQRQQRRQACLGNPIGQRDSQPTMEARGRGSDVPLGLFNHQEDTTRILAEHFSCPGQLHASRRALEQPRANVR